jgi:hypothetical protein
MRARRPPRARAHEGLRLARNLAREVGITENKCTH